MTKPIPFSQIPHKVFVKDFARDSFEYAPKSNLFPNILGGKQLKDVVKALSDAKTKGKPIIWALSGYPVKCGLAPLFLALEKMGYATHYLFCGSTLIHDLEIALFGETSEDVEKDMHKGFFGMSDETATFIKQSLKDQSLGLASRVMATLDSSVGVEAMKNSLLAGSSKEILCFPVPFTETYTMHPAFLNDEDAWAELGRTTHQDFKALVHLLPYLEDGGVFINVASATVMPELLLKTMSINFNEGTAPKNWTAINLNKREEFRTTNNICTRYHAQSYQLLGEIEILIPVIYDLLYSEEAKQWPI